MTTPLQVRKALNPTGRSTSREFLIGYVLPALGAWLLTIWLPGVGGVMVRLTIFAFLGVGVVRRVHDTGRSTWFAILAPIGALLTMWFVSMAGIVLVGTDDPGTAGARLAMIALSLLIVACFLYLFFARGTIGENRYGPDGRATEDRSGVSAGSA
jgi:uncharacterized membrane protein YhaH (DUF805 family)